MASKPRKSWKEKLHDSKGLPKIGKFPPNMSRRWGSGTAVIPAPIEVDEIMRRVPKGRLITTRQIGQMLAAKHKVEMACPITTGIFAWISAHAAAEDLENGRKRVTPFWRTLKPDGSLNPKYHGGIESQASRLRIEGYQIVPAKGKKPPAVADFEKYLWRK